MTRSVCLRALAWLPVATLALTMEAACADTPETRQPEQKRNADMPMTPAQKRYGLPRNPIIGTPVDTDLSKPLALERAIRIGLQLQNSIAIARSQTDSAKARLTQSLSNYYPTVTPSYQYRKDLSPIVGGSREFESRSLGITARQIIYDTGRREANVGLSRRSLYASEYSLADQRQEVILGVTEAYYTLLRNKELVRVQEESVRRAETTLAAIKARVEAQDAAKVDVFQVEADVANARVALLQAQNNHDLAQASLKNAMGIASAQPILFPDAKIAPPNAEPDTAGYEYYTRLAYENRLDLRQQEESINAQGYSVRLAHLRNGITVDVSITEGYQLEPNAGEDRSFVVGISYPLFNGGSTKSDVTEAKASLEADRRRLDQLQQRIRLDVEQSYLTREQARQRRLAADAAAQAGKINYEAALEKQKLGAGNIIDVINAEVQLVNAEVALVQAIYDFYIADARLRRDVGLNDQEYKPNVPGFRPARTRPSAQSGTPQAVAQNAPVAPAVGSVTTTAAERKP